MTVTSKLISRMAAIKKQQSAIMKQITEQTSEIDSLHDEAADSVAKLDELIAKDPFNGELATKRDQYDRVRSGLYAASEYGTGLVAMAKGAR